jgi:glyoxylase-like metal-dependent hydrolase (beta-lactamase superfamily II)
VALELLADRRSARRRGGPGRCGRPWEKLAAAVELQHLNLTHVLLTHHHGDHACHADLWRERTGALVCAHAAERELYSCQLDLELEDGSEIDSGGLTVRSLHVPGHTTGQLNFLVNGAMLFTGDTLFKGSVGGTRGPGHGTLEQLKHSILEVIMAHPPETQIYPGHVDPSSVAAEWESNPFLRAWTGRDAVEQRPCRAFGEDATLLLSAPDYDGGSKCWVRWPDGSEDVVPGSRVEAA